MLPPDLFPREKIHPPPASARNEHAAREECGTETTARGATLRNTLALGRLWDRFLSDLRGAA